MAASTATTAQAAAHPGRPATEKATVPAAAQTIPHNASPRRIFSGLRA
ncbi:hypothetical protein SRIM_009810 [Streptomyces rimosus subsp. rimosus ATCC 10970]|uniref:Uncharacterized protein n=1 Tax=Streptomyces rimosus subsp. rimosus (strain ATCC 10970 / DSM 40260 / JCM 4667 / NRRL 2234) TaxID=1265868 RepID=A0A8A1UIZ3_STRR1|nr:hypothetical protein [Streptomyces sp. SID5471]QGY70516.1 hypothetical protein V519_035710 [Streptomyces rimosus R6-500]QST80430.1 hypothetical protein SRIM_009810 [Streptomyces rimosus subsp. rimosus ATCC 10970]